MADLDRIRWQCRRGLLELDLLLARFLENELPGLNPEQLQLFNELLAESDTEILAWIMEQEEPPARYEKLLSVLRQG